VSRILCGACRVKLGGQRNSLLDQSYDCRGTLSAAVMSGTGLRNGQGTDEASFEAVPPSSHRGGGSPDHPVQEAAIQESEKVLDFIAIRGKDAVAPRHTAGEETLSRRIPREGCPRCQIRGEQLGKRHDIQRLNATERVPVQAAHSPPLAPFEGIPIGQQVLPRQREPAGKLIRTDEHRRTAFVLKREKNQSIGTPQVVSGAVYPLREPVKQTCFEPVFMACSARVDMHRLIRPLELLDDVYGVCACLDSLEDAGCGVTQLRRGRAQAREKFTGSSG